MKTRKYDEAILKYLKRNGKTRQIDLLTDLNIPAGSMVKVAKQLVDEGTVMRDRDGKLFLGPKADPVNQSLKGKWLWCPTKTPKPVLQIRVA